MPRRPLLALALATLAMPAFASLEPGTLPVEPAVATPGATVTSRLHDVSEPIPGANIASSISDHYRIPMADGVEIDVWVVRPNIPGPLPLVAELTPYYGGGDPVVRGADGSGLSTGINMSGIFRELLTRGYAYAKVSVRGTGNSGGCFTIGGPSEAEDLATVVEFLAAQPWSNGNVGAMGVSYPGTAPQDLWVRGTPALKTIVPISGISDMYKYNYVNGVPIDSTIGFNTYYWLIVGLGPVGLNGGAQIADPVSVPGAITGEVCEERIEVTEETFTSFISGNKTEYWQLRDHGAALRADPKRKRASVFYIHGLQDWNVKTHNMEDWIEDLQKANVPFKAWLGQWAHAWPDRSDWTTVITAWFDQFLKERDTGILDAPKVQVKDDAGRWRHEPHWPARGKEVTLYPQADGRLATQAGGGDVSYEDYAGADLNDLPPLPNDRVLFTSAPLSNDLHLSGMPRFEGIAATTGARASLLFTLAEQKPDGSLRAINYAAMSLNHTESLEAGDPDITGEPRVVGVDFYPQDDVIAAGSRIVLIASGNHLYFGNPGPYMRPVTTGTRIVLDMASSRLHLPQDVSLNYEEGL